MSADQLLDRLEEHKRSFDAPHRAELPRLLRRIARRRFTTAAQLIRLHETLLFLRAYPVSAEAVPKWPSICT